MIVIKPFYLIRHGQSFANAEGITSGVLDTCLTDKGIYQANSAAKTLYKLPYEIDTIYHSSLARAKHTALILGDFINARMIENSGLNERNFGKWEGMPWEDTLSQLIKGDEPPEGENNDDFLFRVQQTLNKILLGHKSSSTPILVTHGGFFHTLSCLYECKLNYLANSKIFFFKPKNNHFMPWQVFSVIMRKNNIHFIEEDLFYI